MTEDHRIELGQESILASFVKDAGQEPWTTLYESNYADRLNSVARYSALAPAACRDRFLADQSWDLTIGHGRPGIEMYKGSYTYFRFGNSDGIEPLVVITGEHGKRESQTFLSEEFRLAFNLWEEKSTGNWLYTNPDGSEDVVAEVGRKRIRVRTSFLARFRALRQLDLWLYIDSTRYSSKLPTDLDYSDLCREWRDAGGRGFISVRGEPGLDGVLSVLTAKRYLPPPPFESNGFWPFDNKRESYIEFIIGESDVGDPKTYSCDPALLANYFGLNPGAPHYLTPVFFRPSVLDKYYADPELYEVSDGLVACSGLWSLRLDNDNSDYVSVFLGDLGQYLPESERAVWRASNIAPLGPMSDTAIGRAFKGQWLDAARSDHRFRDAYSRLDSSWRVKHGWSLYRTTSCTEQLIGVRIPSENQHEFDEQILRLSKIMVDSLDDSAIEAVVGAGPPGERSISKLERLLASVSYVSTDRDIALLRSIQQLRSKGSAHVKGRSYERLLDKQLNGRTRRQFIDDCLNACVQTLDGWTQIPEVRRPASDT